MGGGGYGRGARGSYSNNQDFNGGGGGFDLGYNNG
jgi:hypothetical protein